MDLSNWHTSVKEDELSPTAGRKAVHGEYMTMARFRFDKGNVVAVHQHANDQITTCESGSVKMSMGDKEFIMKAGDVVHVPPNVPHGNVALEDTIIVEVFSPVREDWIKGDDSYLRAK